MIPIILFQAEKNQKELTKYLNDARDKLDNLFCKAADAGGAAESFQELHVKMQKVTHPSQTTPLDNNRDALTLIVFGGVSKGRDRAS